METPSFVPIGNPKFYQSIKPKFSYEVETPSFHKKKITTNSA
jgi:hypothetical protein